jgi:hypothetical protein
MDPVKYEDGMPVYTLDQVHMYGEPWLWGVDAYLVISTFENEKPPAQDWKFEQVISCVRFGLRPTLLRNHKTSSLTLLGEDG